MKKILIINGPNLNMLGIREPQLYGNKTYKDLICFIKKAAKESGLRVKCIQSNHEGKLVSSVQKARGRFAAIVINAGAYTHTSLALLDALKAAGLPAVEVHLTDIGNREEYRRFSYIGEYAEKTICGKGFEGYAEALSYLKS